MEILMDIFNKTVRGMAYLQEWKMGVVCPIYENKGKENLIIIDCLYYQ
jgi:hypothetical protein